MQAASRLAEAPAPTSEPLALETCLAGVRSALAAANAAADAWSEGRDPSPSLQAASGAVARAESQLALLRQELPSHARRVRFAARAIERVLAAIAAARLLPRTPLDLDGPVERLSAEAEEQLLGDLSRVFEAAERALQAATTH